MKKSIVLLVSLLIAYNVFASGPKWKVIKDTYVYELLWDGINFEKTDKLLKKGTEVTGVWSGTSPNPFTKTEMVNIDEYEKYYIDVMSVVPAEADVLFDDKLLKPNMILNNKVFVAEAYFKALKEQDRNILIELEKEGFKNYEKNKSDMDYEWYESEAQHYYESEIYNVSIMLINVFSSYHFMIRKISKINSGYNVTAAVTLFCEFENKNYIIPEKDDVIKLKIVLDGDYLNVYYRENLLGVYIITDKKTSDEIAKFILKNTCNYSFITWPRHADGSCDYDGSKKAHTATKPAAISSTQTTNVAPNKTMTVKENLKLRSGEAATTSVLAVMSTGTKVKILALGKQATIDGITSNWVQVEVQAGAKDRDGKSIAAGATGWCFGGYLE